MIFDSRIKKEDDIFHYFNRKKAAQYIGKPGYFADYLTAFKDKKFFEDFETGVLSEINDNQESCYIFGGTRFGFKFFIPKELLKKSLIMVPKYRPWKFEEFIKEFSIGESIFEMRSKDKEASYMLLYTGYYSDDRKSEPVIKLGDNSYSLSYLFDLYEVSENIGDEKIWHPFGVLDVSEEYIEKPKRDEVLLCSKEEKNH